MFVRFIALLLALLMLAPPSHAQLAAAPLPTAILFINVNVVPMDSERVLRRQSVLIRDGRIAAVGRRIDAPAGARMIDGGGAYLLPGLADMHVHVDRNDLPVMLAHGITTALHMGEARNSFVGRTRLAVAAGQSAGPRVLAALAVDGSPQYGHLVVTDDATARATIQVARANGYEFIKAYNGLSPEAFAALVAAGRDAGIPVVGHSVEAVGLERQIAAGQVMIAHLEEFLYAFFRIPEGAAVPPDAEIARAIAFLRQHGTTVAADLVTFQTIARQWARPDAVQVFLRLPETRYLSAADRMSWRDSGYQRRTGNLEARAAFLARFVEALADAGIPLIAGTDAPTIPGLVAGDALHHHLAALEAAGLSRFQALATATREPGAFVARTLRGAAPFGTIAEGLRADLILVPGNPLDDLAVLRRPLGVMAAGRWHDSAALRTMLNEAAERYAATP